MDDKAYKRIFGETRRQAFKRHNYGAMPYSSPNQPIMPLEIAVFDCGSPEDGKDLTK